MQNLLISLLLSPVIYVPPTPDMLTRAATRYDCRLVDEQMRPFPLKFRSEGGRGYWAAPGEARRTERRYIVEEDPLGLLPKSPRVSPMREHYGSVLSGDGVYAYVEEIPHTLDLGAVGRRTTLVVTVSHGEPVARRFAGFCDISEPSPQQPLTESETRALLASLAGPDRVGKAPPPEYEISADELEIWSAFNRTHPLPRGEKRRQQCWSLIGAWPEAHEQRHPRRFNPLPGFEAEDESINAAWQLVAGVRRVFVSDQLKAVSSGCAFGAAYRPIIQGNYAFLLAGAHETGWFWDVFRRDPDEGWTKVASATLSPDGR